MPRVLLLDTIKPVATQAFETAGFQVDTFSKSLTPVELTNSLAGIEVLGIRSDPKLPAEIMQASHELVAIGCFGVGTDHVDIQAANQDGIAVFNSPYENGRSVAELVMGATYSLMRKLHEHNLSLHASKWTKTDEASYELRNKTMGIVGYGNIGQQAGSLAEANGMQVLYFDTQDRPRLGNARKAYNLEGLLEEADVVSVHVPGGLDKPVMGKWQFAQMQKGAVLINTARSTAVDYDALLEAIKSGHLGGAALDVFSKAEEKDPFISELTEEPRILLTPHIGGSTQEAQVDAARSVTQKLISFVLLGSTVGSVNLPNLDVALKPDNTTRITYIHANQPGANAELGVILSKEGLNVAEERLKASGEIGYAALDLEGQIDVDELRLTLAAGLHHSIRLRIL